MKHIQSRSISVKIPHLFVKVIGGLYLLIGGIAAYYALLEFHCFYLFSEGGPFYYPGFGFGSLWFGLLVVNSFGYYFLAAVCLPLGIGHLIVRRWAHTVALLVYWLWVASGIVMLAYLALLLPRIFTYEIAHHILVVRVIIVTGFIALFFVFLPLFLIWLYHLPSIKSAFAQHDKAVYWTERIPFPVLLLLAVCTGWFILLHFSIFFQCTIPF